MSLLLPQLSSRRGRPFNILTLVAHGENGGFFDKTSSGTLWQDTAATTPGATGSAVRRHDDVSGLGHNATEATNPPLLRSGGVECVGQYTLTVNFGSSLGSNCTIFRAIPGYGEEFLTGQTIGPTYTITVPYAYFGIVNRALSAWERLKLVDFLRSKAGISNVMWHVTIEGQSLPLGTNTNAAGNAGEVVDDINHDSRAKMFTVSGTGVASPYGPRPWLDQLPANNNQVLNVAKVTGIETLHEAVNDVTGGKYGETLCTGFAAQFFRGDSASSDQILFELHGRGGTGYRELGTGAGLEPGFQHFANGVLLQDRADLYGTLPRRLLCALNGHGQFEQSSGRSRANYALDLQDWVTQVHEHQRRNYHPLAPTKMLMGQPANGQPTNGFPIAAAVLDAYLVHPDLVSANPQYIYQHSDGIHMRALGNRAEGELCGRIARRLIRPQLGDMPWAGPTYPISAVRTGATIVVMVNVSDGVLVLDTTNVAAATNSGVIYSDDSSSASVSSVAITGDKQITVTLNTTPTGTNPRLRFGCTQTNTQDTGPTAGMRTNFRNSIGEVGVLTGVTHYDWMAICDLAVTT